MKKKSKQITIDLEEIGQVVKQADEILLSPAGERNLLKILDAEEALKEFRHQAEVLLEQKAKKIDRNFNIIRGDEVKVQYRSYGTRYKVDESNLDKLPRQLYKKLVRYNPVTKEIDRFYDENGNLPLGIIEHEREKKIYINRVKGSKDE